MVFFHVFKIVQMVPNRATHHIYSVMHVFLEKIRLQFKIKILLIELLKFNFRDKHFGIWAKIFEGNILREIIETFWWPFQERENSRHNFKQIYLDWQSFFLNFILYCFIRKNESIFTIYKIFYLFIIDLDCYMMGLKIMKSFLRKKFSKKTFFKHYFAKMSFGRSSFMNLVLYFLLLFIKIVLKELQFL